MTGMLNPLAATVVFLITLLQETNSAKILVLPIPLSKSHVNGLAEAGSALLDDGHDVTMLVPEMYKAFASKRQLKTITYADDILNQLEQDRMFDRLNLARGEIMKSNLRMMKIIPKAVSDQCEAILSNTKIMDKIANENFDLAMSEGNSLFACINIIMYKLDIPFYIYSFNIFPLEAAIPAMPSTEIFPSLPFTPDMTLFQKMQNFLTLFFPVLFTRDNSMIEKYVPEKPSITLNELLRKSQLWLLSAEIMCLDYPRISAPHYQFIGSSTAQKSKPLPQDLADFMDNAERGVVIVSFGSSMEFRSGLIYHIDKFLDAFRNIPQKVILALNCHEFDVPSNVKCLDWTPQNDLLAHANTLLFINHGGGSGQMEAISHGIPMITIGVMSEQIYNGIRTSYHMFGKQLYLHLFTSEELVSAINEVITNDTYRQSTKKCAEIISDFPSAKDKVVFWTNHLLKFGGSHLRHPSLDMPIYKLFMLDVLGVLFLSGVLILIALYVFSCCLFKWCCKHRNKEKSD